MKFTKSLSPKDLFESDYCRVVYCRNHIHTIGHPKNWTAYFINWEGTEYAVCVKHAIEVLVINHPDKMKLAEKLNEVKDNTSSSDSESRKYLVKVMEKNIDRAVKDIRIIKGGD